MGISGSLAAAASLASLGTSIYSATRKDKPLVLPTPPDATADQVNAANSAALAGKRARDKAAAGTTRASTILTGPQGVTTPAPGGKTLLGL